MAQDPSRYERALSGHTASSSARPRAGVEGGSLPGPPEVRPRSRASPGTPPAPPRLAPSRGRAARPGRIRLRRGFLGPEEGRRVRALAAARGAVSTVGGWDRGATSLAPAAALSPGWASAMARERPPGRGCGSLSQCLLGAALLLGLRLCAELRGAGPRSPARSAPPAPAPAPRLPAPPLPPARGPPLGASRRQVTYVRSGRRAPHGGGGGGTPEPGCCAPRARPRRKVSSNPATEGPDPAPRWPPRRGALRWGPRRPSHWDLHRSVSPALRGGPAGGTGHVTERAERSSCSARPLLAARGAAPDAPLPVSEGRVWGRGGKGAVTLFVSCACPSFLLGAWTELGR